MLQNVKPSVANASRLYVLPCFLPIAQLELVCFFTDEIQRFPSGSWYIPLMLGIEFRVWKKLTLEGGMNLYYNNGGNWDKQGIAHLSLGGIWHW
ncbi:MAG: hypothetical protein ACKVT2_15605 [Saprospiraceae bacterium]